MLQLKTAFQNQPRPEHSFMDSQGYVDIKFKRVINHNTQVFDSPPMEE